MGSKKRYIVKKLPDQFTHSGLVSDECVQVTFQVRKVVRAHCDGIDKWG